MEKFRSNLSSKAVAAINAVEGLYLSEDSKARLNSLESNGLTADMKIEAIRKAYRKQIA